MRKGKSQHSGKEELQDFLQRLPHLLIRSIADQIINGEEQDLPEEEKVVDDRHRRCHENKAKDAFFYRPWILPGAFVPGAGDCGVCTIQC